MTEAHLVNMAGHAAVGCGMAVAAGGKCGSGALSGLAPAFAGPLLPTHNSAARLMTKATLGGLGSVAGGGKFENGAITGAFGYLFNDLGHMLVGNDAHYQLLRHLQIRDGDDVWSGNSTFYGLFGRGRPDLLYNDAPYQVFEIKPEGADAAGAAQLQRYLNTAGSQSMAGDFGRIFEDGPSLTLTGGWFGTTYTYSPGAHAGVVTYTVNQRNVFGDALRLFNQKPVGGPLPLPGRRPPIRIP